ncbi:hypothetical protein SAMN04489726_2263 [Allokutzneria albata]|uniref:Uncharacterized protein n=1 Tax=Allokutzneria albata TaxID=211114 RepID=A0A1G9U8I8_ALLAB|nr:hypothetical protein SAMN04489726_2263 [Allokutzneria albata]
MNLACNFVVSHQVEYREGGPSDHFQAWVLRESDWDGVFDRGFEQVVRVVCDWVADRPGWCEALPWRPLDLGDGSQPLG